MEKKGNAEEFRFFNFLIKKIAKNSKKVVKKWQKVGNLNLLSKYYQ